jgi:DNA-binding response OmpR family regulator
MTPASKERGRDAAARGSEVVIVVEDEPTVRVPIVRTLRNRGFTVLEAANGAEALRIVAGHQGTIACVVTDVMMPEMKGTELVEALRLASPKMCAVFISGLPAELAGVDYESIGGAAFLTKPFSLAALAEQVRALIELT